MTIPDTIEIDVTARDIAEGVPKNCSGCPIALAAQRVLPEFDNIIVGESIVVEGEEFYRYSMTNEALEFVGAFDNGQEVSPFKFTAVRR